MNVLVITPSYPPYQGSHTQRMIQLCNAIAESGINTAVLTTEILEGNPTYDPALMMQVNKSIRVFRAPFGVLHKRAYTSNVAYTDEKYGKNKESKRGTSIKVKVVEKVKNAVLIPDSLIDWKKPAIKYLEQENIIQSFKPDWIISCSMPNTVHLIARYIYKKYRIPTVLDYADPWVYLDYYEHGRFRFFLERRMEEKCLKIGSLYSFSTYGAEELYIEKFGLDKKKCFTVVTGYDGSLKTGTGKISIKSKDERYILSYGGAIQMDIRRPQTFINIIQEFSDSFELRIRTDNVSEINGLIGNRQANVSVDSYIPFNSYYEEMLQSDALVFWGNTTSDQLPGKIFNYIPTKKIIFYIANNPDKTRDQAVSVLEDYGNYIYVNNDENSLRKGLHVLLDYLNKGQNVHEVEQSKVDKYSTNNQFQIFVKRLQDFSEN